MMELGWMHQDLVVEHHILMSKLEQLQQAHHSIPVRH